MLTPIITYLIASQVLMVFFIIVNRKVLEKQYLEMEKDYNGTPSNGWYNFYIFAHFLKAPLLTPMIFMLILGNGGVIE